jgi:hypothetical protein
MYYLADTQEGRGFTMAYYEKDWQGNTVATPKPKSNPKCLDCPNMVQEFWHDRCAPCDVRHANTLFEQHLDHIAEHGGVA